MLNKLQNRLRVRGSINLDLSLNLYFLEVHMSVSESTGAQQFLTFKLGEEIFAVEVSKVREILDVTAITKVPQTHDFMRGVINLRGGVVPVIDLRLKLGMTRTENTVNTCIIVEEITVGGGTVVLGTLADSVQEVFDLDGTQIEPPPRIGTRINNELLKGMAKHNDGFIMILDIDKVFSSDEIESVQSTQGAAA
jgi:purine-binding chemotaxis protein CheW